MWSGCPLIFPVSLDLPAVLSAVSGLSVGIPSLSTGFIEGVTCAIILLVFLSQRYGTGLVGRCFAPIIIMWLLANAAIGVYK